MLWQLDAWLKLDPEGLGAGVAMIGMGLNRGGDGEGAGGLVVQGPS